MPFGMGRQVTPKVAMKMSKGRAATIVIATMAVGWIVYEIGSRAPIMLDLAIDLAIKRLGELYVVWPEAGEFADLALDEETSLIIADFRCHVLDESKHAKYLPFKRLGRIIGIRKGTNVKVLDKYIVLDGRVRRDISVYPVYGRFQDGASLMFKVKVTGGPNKGVMGWLPEGDVRRKYAMP